MIEWRPRCILESTQLFRDGGLDDARQAGRSVGEGPLIGEERRRTSDRTIHRGVVVDRDEQVGPRPIRHVGPRRQLIGDVDLIVARKFDGRLVDVRIGLPGHHHVDARPIEHPRQSQPDVQVDVGLSGAVPADGSVERSAMARVHHDRDEAWPLRVDLALRDRDPLVRRRPAAVLRHRGHDPIRAGRHRVTVVVATVPGPLEAAGTPRPIGEAPHLRPAEVDDAKIDVIDCLVELDGGRDPRAITVMDQRRPSHHEPDARPFWRLVGGARDGARMLCCSRQRRSRTQRQGKQ